MQPAGNEKPAGCNFYSQATAGSSVQTLTMFCFELPAVFIITYLIVFRIVITIMQGQVQKYYPEKLYKDKDYTIKNMPENIKYADMKNNTIEEKERLLAKWNY